MSVSIGIFLSYLLILEREGGKEGGRDIDLLFH